MNPSRGPLEITPTAVAEPPRGQDTTALLIRHGHTDALGRRLSGRSPDVHLSDEGHDQAVRLVQQLQHSRIDAIYSSPMLRAIQTAEPLACARNLPVAIRDDLNEIDFGEWTGLSFDDLAGMPAWHHFNTRRSIAPVPGGESASDAQRRILAALARLRYEHCGQTIVVVSHADVIRGALLHYCGVPLDDFDRFTIDPASITTVILTESAGTVRDVAWAEWRHRSSADGPLAQAGPRLAT